MRKHEGARSVWNYWYQNLLTLHLLNTFSVCRKQEKRSSEPLAPEQFLSAFFLLLCGVCLAAGLCVSLNLYCISRVRLRHTKYVVNPDSNKNNHYNYFTRSLSSVVGLAHGYTWQCPGYPARLSRTFLYPVSGRISDMTATSLVGFSIELAYIWPRTG